MESDDAVTWLAPGLRRVRAPNAGPMTYTGTNSYLVGTGAVALIDPGPALPAHRDRLLAALDPGERIALILVTHAHRDHSALAPALAEATGAPVCASGPAGTGRSATMAALAGAGGIGGGEGVDHAFRPDRTLADGARLSGDWGEIEALETPGHMEGHLSFGWGTALFTGDTVMGWSTSLVSPPEGDMGAYMRSLARLTQRADRIHHPGHGEPVTEPQARLAELIAHRRAREAQIRAALAGGSQDIATLTRAVYTDVAPKLLPIAERNVFAHLIDLVERNEVTAEPALAPGARFRRA